MFIIDSLLVGGIRFVLDKLALAAEQELDSVETLQQTLLEAQQELEDGVISDEAFGEIERSVLGRLRALKRTNVGGLADGESFEGIEISGDDE